MIERDKLSKKLSKYLYGEGFTEAEIAEGFSLVPRWIPDEFLDFWRQFTEFNPPSTIFLTPDPYGSYSSAIEGFYEEFKELEFPGQERFFPVAAKDVFHWGVFENQENGKVVCGMYDFQTREYYKGPFESFEDWVLSYG